MKPVNDIVDKVWASKAKEILTGNAPDITTVFTRLLTITLESKQSLKSQAARDRFDLACKALNDGLKYGWAFGVNEQQVRFKRPAQFEKSRRVRALLPLAVAAGEAVGKAQAARIVKAHGIPAPGSVPIRHTHTTRPV